LDTFEYPSYETRNQSLLYTPIPNTNHSGLGIFVRSSLPGRNHPSEKFRQEEQRWQVPQAFFSRTVQNLKEYLQRCTTELVFNLEEVGVSDWEDRKTRNIIVPAAMGGRMIPHRISRNIKQISVLACFSAVGESFTPDIITPQDSASVREQFKKQGVRFGMPCINATIFLDYIQIAFLLDLAELCRLDEFVEEMAVLLIDNCLSHITSDMIAHLTEV
jgi:hypothetical protein